MGDLLADVLPDSLPSAFLFWNIRNFRTCVGKCIVVVIIVIIIVTRSFAVRSQPLKTAVEYRSNEFRFLTIPNNWNTSTYLWFTALMVIM